MGKRRMWEMLGEWQNPGTVKEECQGQGECLMSVTSTLSLFKKKSSIITTSSQTYFKPAASTSC